LIQFDQTIAAIATPIGEGGLAVIRVSGPEALSIADSCFKPTGRNKGIPSQATSHTIHYGNIVRDGRIIDEVMLSIMRAPRTFTREDVVEISCHGGILPAKAVLDTCLANGARTALPGEFTKRAFLNGRIDLTQAEAVIDLIHSKTDQARSAATEQLRGNLSKKIGEVRTDLMAVLAHLEAHIDFPDEDIAPDTMEDLVKRLKSGIELIRKLSATATEGRILRNGIRTAIIGRPNAGKSSLLNQLLGHDRAIVSPTKGTTRDTIEEIADIRGIPVRFIDTAGLGETDNEIEKEGIRRSLEVSTQAELILHVLDSGETFSDVDRKYLSEFAPNHRILILNKSDRHQLLDGNWEQAASLVKTNCLSGAGIETLKDKIEEVAWQGRIQADMNEVMVNSRHQESLKRALDSVETALTTLEVDSSFELVAMDLRIGVQAIGEIVGKTTTEDLLDTIFSTFCIGK